MSSVDGQSSGKKRKRKRNRSKGVGGGGGGGGSNGAAGGMNAIGSPSNGSGDTFSQAELFQRARMERQKQRNQQLSHHPSRGAHDRPSLSGVRYDNRVGPGSSGDGLQSNVLGGSNQNRPSMSSEGGFAGRTASGATFVWEPKKPSSGGAPVSAAAPIIQGQQQQQQLHHHQIQQQQQKQRQQLFHPGASGAARGLPAAGSHGRPSLRLGPLSAAAVARADRPLDPPPFRRQSTLLRAAGTLGEGGDSPTSSPDRSLPRSRSSDTIAVFEDGAVDSPLPASQHPLASSTASLDGPSAAGDHLKRKRKSSLASTQDLIAETVGTSLDGDGDGDDDDEEGLVSSTSSIPVAKGRSSPSAASDSGNRGAPRSKAAIFMAIEEHEQKTSSLEQKIVEAQQELADLRGEDPATAAAAAAAAAREAAVKAARDRLEARLDLFTAAGRTGLVEAVYTANRAVAQRSDAKCVLPIGNAISGAGSQQPCQTEGSGSASDLRRQATAEDQAAASALRVWVADQPFQDQLDAVSESIQSHEGPLGDQVRRAMAHRRWCTAVKRARLGRQWRSLFASWSQKRGRTEARLRQKYEEGAALMANGDYYDEAGAIRDDPSFGNPYVPPDYLATLWSTSALLDNKDNVTLAPLAPTDNSPDVKGSSQAPVEIEIKVKVETVAENLSSTDEIKVELKQETKTEPVGVGNESQAAVIEGGGEDPPGATDSELPVKQEEVCAAPGDDDKPEPSKPAPVPDCKAEPTDQPENNDDQSTGEEAVKEEQPMEIDGPVTGIESAAGEGAGDVKPSPAGGDVLPSSSQPPKADPDAMSTGAVDDKDDLRNQLTSSGQLTRSGSFSTGLAGGSPSLRRSDSVLSQAAFERTMAELQAAEEARLADEAAAAELAATAAVGAAGGDLQSSQTGRLRADSVVMRYWEPVLATATPQQIDDYEPQGVRFHDENGRVRFPDLEHQEHRLSRAWSPAEQTTFVKSFLLTPKDFSAIAATLPNRSTADCVSFYYSYKHKFELKRLLGVYLLKRKTRSASMNRSRSSTADLSQLDDQSGGVSGGGGEGSGAAASDLNDEWMAAAVVEGAASLAFGGGADGASGLVAGAVGGALAMVASPGRNSKGKGVRRIGSSAQLARSIGDNDGGNRSSPAGKSGAGGGVGGSGLAASTSSLRSSTRGLVSGSPVPPGAWSDGDKSFFKEALCMVGRNWDLVAARLGGTKTPAQCKMFYHQHKESEALDSLLTEEELAKPERGGDESGRKRKSPMSANRRRKQSRTGAESPLATHTSTEANQTPVPESTDGSAPAESNNNSDK